MNESTPEQESVQKKEEGGFLKIFLITLSLALVIRIFIAQPFIVNGGSMVPTFDNGDYLIVDELSYRLREPARGEVIIFKFPRDPKKFFIKRIVGLPNETLEIKDGVLFVTKDGTTKQIDEPYLKDNNSDDVTATLGSNEYFVMGDNRELSSDSRIWGPVEENLIIGRALFRFLPITEASVLPGDFSL